MSKLNPTRSNFRLTTESTHVLGNSVSGATSGSLLFVDSGVNLAQDNANLFWDATNTRLGISETTPAGKLHVNQASTSGAIPVIHLVQADIDQDFFEFETTIGTGNAVEAIAAKSLTTTHFVKVTLNGVGTLFFPIGTIA